MAGVTAVGEGVEEEVTAVEEEAATAVGVVVAMAVAEDAIPTHFFFSFSLCPDVGSLEATISSIWGRMELLYPIAVVIHDARRVI